MDNDDYEKLFNAFGVGNNSDEFKDFDSILSDLWETFNKMPKKENKPLKPKENDFLKFDQLN